jgi:hypothetical protein
MAKIWPDCFLRPFVASLLFLILNLDAHFNLLFFGALFVCCSALRTLCPSPVKNFPLNTLLYSSLLCCRVSLVSSRSNARSPGLRFSASQL